jgi:hypothetical protein
MIKKLSIETSNSETSFSAITCTSKWAISALPPKYLFPDKKEEPSVELPNYIAP